MNLKIQTGDAPEKVARFNALGLDMGLNAFVATSEGGFYPAPKNFRKAEKKLRRHQRALARCRHGSNRRQKVKQRVTVLHAYVKNCRKDFAHKLSRDLVGQVDMIAVEDLKIRGMVKSKHLSKSISDAGWGQFIEMIACKAESAGKHFAKVDPRNTSQCCSGCGAVVKKSLAQRDHHCPDCGLEMDRDKTPQLTFARGDSQSWGRTIQQANVMFNHWVTGDLPPVEPCKMQDGFHFSKNCCQLIILWNPAKCRVAFTLDNGRMRASDLWNPVKCRVVFTDARWQRARNIGNSL